MGIIRSIGKVIVENAGAMIIGGALFSVLDKLSKNLDRSKAVKDLQRKYEWLSIDLTRVERDVNVLSMKVEYLEEEDKEEEADEEDMSIPEIPGDEHEIVLPED